MRRRGGTFLVLAALACGGGEEHSAIDAATVAVTSLRAVPLDEKIEATGWKARYQAEDVVTEIVSALEAGETDKTTETITLDWYQALAKFRGVLNDVEIDGELLDLPELNQ